MHLRKATSRHDTKVNGIRNIAHLVRNLWLGKPSLYLSAGAFNFFVVERFIIRQTQIIDNPTAFQKP